MLVASLALLSVLGQASAVSKGLRGHQAAVAATASPICLNGVESLGSFAPVCGKPAASVVTEVDIVDIANTVRASLDALVLGMTPAEQAHLYGTAYELVLHDASELDVHADDLLGADGCLSHSSLNAALVEPTSPVTTIIEPLWQQHCDKISRADFWVLFAKIALEKADVTNSLWLPFQFGRKDATFCNSGVERLLNAQRDEDDIFRVFVQQMDLTSVDAVTLMGGRSVGFHGSHSWDATPDVFDNAYYKQLLDNAWKASYDPLDRSKNLWLGTTAAVPGDSTLVPYTTNSTWGEQLETSPKPSAAPTLAPIDVPTQTPTLAPTAAPSAAPTAFPTVAPTELPTQSPTVTPTLVPTVVPTQLPTLSPTASPTELPTVVPTELPTLSPSAAPSALPTVSPSTMPTLLPSATPTLVPTLVPTATPTKLVPGKSPSKTGPPTKSPKVVPRKLQAASTSVALQNVDISLAYPNEPQFNLYYKEYMVRMGDSCGQFLLAGGKGQGCVNLGKEVAGASEHSMDRVKLYAANQDVFLAYFSGAFERLTTAGYSIAGYVMPAGKLGVVTPLAI